MGPLYDAVGFGMGAYVRLAFRLRRLGPAQLRLAPRTLIVSTHRRESDVPVIASELYFRASLWKNRSERMHFAARDDMFLAGFFGGVVEKERIIDGRSIRPGDALLGLAASGPHSNGFSLIRKILEREKPNSMAALMEPTRIYVKPVLKLLESVPVKGLAHITGGGITGNVPRVLPDGLRAVVKKAAWPRPDVFQWLQRVGGVAESEMHAVFNCGIGMVLVVDPADARRAAENLRASGETVYEIGAIEKGPGGEADCVVI